MKKVLMILLVAIMLIGSCTVCMAENADATKEADVLHSLGLFNGTGTDADGKPIYSLENKLSRQEAAALLVRFLGKEKAAKNESFDIPFTDVDDWAKPYVGYAYKNGLVSGISETSFGSRNPISATEYLTLILRALGHSDKDGDFVWNSAWTLSDKLGMTNGQYNTDNNGDFCRKDAVYISYMALLQKINGSGQTLAGKLFSEDVFSAEQLESTKDKDLIKASGHTPEETEKGNQVAAVTGITFQQRGVYVKMTLVQPEDKTGIVGYEALIYNKDNPDEAVHRSIKFEDGTAHYRLDNPENIKMGIVYNRVKVISNAAEGYAPAFWEDDISITFVNKDITIAEAWVENEERIALNLADVENGFMGYVFTRKDGSVLDDESFFVYVQNKAGYYNLNKWSEEDKKALENGEISVSLTGIYIDKITDADGSWVIDFERIKSPAVAIKCDVDLVK